MLKNISCLVLVLCVPTLALATTNWTGAVSTDFFDIANWDGNLPNSGEGTKMSASGFTSPPAFQPLLVNGSVDTYWYEVSHGVELTIGTNGIFNVLTGSDSASMAQAAGTTGTINLVDNGKVVSLSNYAAWEGDAFINMSGTSQWVSDAPGQPWTLGHWDDSGAPRLGVATMTMSDDSMLTVTSGDFRIRGNHPAAPTAPKSFLIMNDNAKAVIGGDQSGKIQSYIDDGMIINGQVTFDGTNTIITAIPEPSTMLLLGLAGLALLRRKR